MDPRARCCAYGALMKSATNQAATAMVLDATTSALGTFGRPTLGDGLFASAVALATNTSGSIGSKGPGFGSAPKLMQVAIFGGLQFFLSANSVGHQTNDPIPMPLCGSTPVVGLVEPLDCLTVHEEVQRSIAPVCRPQSPTAHAVGTQLKRARHCESARDAYIHFAHAAEALRGTGSPEAWSTLLRYLQDHSSPFRDTLLGSLIDSDVPLPGGAVPLALSKLLRDGDPRVARSAAFLLAEGGEEQTSALIDGTNDLTSERRADLVRFLEFSGAT